MFDRFDYWKYTNDHNCWDFVREWWIDKGISPDDIPRFGICPTNKREMTKAAQPVISELVECGPIQNSVACHYHGNLLLHVGMVDNGIVRHAHPKMGCRRDTIKRFEVMAQRTIYRIPKCLQ